ncbi:MAG: DUF3575 domain-containing protein [Muribaculaceae bacterium]|nr:DUF3575 domain-containing protein [Muribaculaceae bacterium]
MKFGENKVSWGLFREIIADLDEPWREEALSILSIGNDNNSVDNTRRMNRLKRLSGGKAWRVIKQDVLPRLRSAMVVSTVVTVRQPEIEEPAIEEIYLEEGDADTEIPSDLSYEQCDRNIITGSVRDCDYDRIAIKTNGLFLAAGISNLGAEYAFHKHWSVDIPLVYSPYTIARTYRMRFLYVQPELRYWTSRALRGHFFGVHLHAGVFNVSVDRKNRYQSEKGFHGAGVSYGYSLPLARRWSLEFTVGIGYAFTKYCTYYNVHNGIKYQDDIPYNYWGIDKLGVNIEYRFGDRSGKRKGAQL